MVTHLLHNLFLKKNTETYDFIVKHKKEDYYAAREFPQ